MISILLYGRNDNYGYNLHKRAALSFNCMAELLDEERDEIVFVDYNTPDDFPTFPEAIRDTLTRKARDKLRILRVRPRIHEQFKSKTHLVAIEPIARNIGVRRTNPDNRWVLSTNTDMIFIARSPFIKWRSRSLDDVVRDCPAGFYHAPRIEIPETLWESLDRTRPRDAMKAIRQWGPALHLNEIVFGSDTILYDGPGDFQLVQRSDLFRIHAFNEEMLIGWHVDSNIAKRLRLIYEEVGDLGDSIFGYHCDHTRQITPMHGPARLENDSRVFVDEVTRPDLPQQADTWGFPNEDIEEIRLRSDPSRAYVSGLLDFVGAPMREPSKISYTGANYDKVDYDPAHILPFLMDVFCSYERKSTVAWYGARNDTLGMFCQIWKALGFTGAILIDANGAKNGLATAPEAELVEPERLKSEAVAFVFDFGMLADRQGALPNRALEPVVQDVLISGMLGIIEAERSRLSGNLPLRRIITINAINNRFERFVRLRLGVGHTPFATRIRQGFVLPPVKGRQDWLPVLQVGDAGVRVGRIIKTHTARLGTVAFGPYRYLDSGQYRLQIRLNSELPVEQAALLFVEVCIETRVIAATMMGQGHHEIYFEIPEKLVARLEYCTEIRITAMHRSAYAISELSIEPIHGKPKSDVSTIECPSEWLPLLRTGAGTTKMECGIEVDRGLERIAIYGPYLPLAPGRYVCHSKLKLQKGFEGESANAQFGYFDIAADGSNVLSSRRIDMDDFAEGERDVHVDFEVPATIGEELPALIETRLWTSGRSRFRIESVSVRRWNGGSWLAALDRGEAGRWESAAIKSRPGQTGCVANGYFKGLGAGRYRFELKLEADGRGERNRIDELAVVIEAKVNGRSIATHGLSRADCSLPVHQIVFDLPAEAACDPKSAVEMRIVAVRPIRFTIHEASLDPVADTTPLSANFLVGADWLPLLKLGPAGVRENCKTTAKKGEEGYLVFGPYTPLPAGRYAAVAMLEPLEYLQTAVEQGAFDVATNGSTVLAVKHLSEANIVDGTITIIFEVPTCTPDKMLPLIETRIYTNGHLPFQLALLKVSHCNS